MVLRESLVGEMMSKILISIIILCGFAYADAASEVDLGQAQQLVLEKSPRIIRMRSAAREASAKSTEAFSVYLPTLQISSTYLGGYRYLLTDITLGGSAVSVPAVVPTTQLVVQANYLLFDGFASTNKYKASKQMDEAAHAEVDWTEFQLAREVSLAYYKTVAALALKEVAEKNLKTLTDHLNEIELFRKAGVSTNYDVLRVQVQVSEAQAEVLNSTDNVEIFKAKLVETLGGEIVTPKSKELPNLSVDLAKGITLQDIKGRKDILAGQQRVEATELMESSSGRYLVPKLSLFGQYQYYNNLNDRFADTSKFRDAYQYGLQLTWNAFDGLVSQSRSKQAAEQRVQAEQVYRSAVLHAEQDLDLWKRKFNYFVTVAKSKRVDVERSLEAVRLAREGRKVGSRTNTELLDVEADLFRSRAALVNAEMGAVESLINLELASGKSLYSWNKAE